MDTSLSMSQIKEASQMLKALALNEIISIEVSAKQYGVIFDAIIELKRQDDYIIPPPGFGPQLNVTKRVPDNMILMERGDGSYIIFNTESKTSVIVPKLKVDEQLSLLNR